jgi:hypothetical protein
MISEMIVVSALTQRLWLEVLRLSNN